MFLRQQSDPREVTYLIFGTPGKFIGEPRLKRVIFYLQTSLPHLTYLGRFLKKNNYIKWKEPLE